MRYAHWIGSLALVASVGLSGCRSDQDVAKNADNKTSTETSTNQVAARTLPSGTVIEVTLASNLSSEDASVGDAWTGSTRDEMVLEAQNVIPAGSTVAGTVTSVKPARKGDRAMLDLGLTSITVGDHTYPVGGTTEAIVAGSTRARNLGAIGAETGVVAQSKGWQVVLKEGTGLTFTTNEAVAMRP